jgi:hypothetical protein
MVGVNVSPVSVTAGAADAGVFGMHHDIIPKSPTKTTIPTVPILFFDIVSSSFLSSSFPQREFVRVIFLFFKSSDPSNVLYETATSFHSR